MINIVIASNKINFSVELMNKIHTKNSNIRIFNITSSSIELIEILNKTKNIDIILLEEELINSNNINVFQKITNRDKYKNSFIILSNNYENIKKLYKNKMIHSYIDNTIEKILKTINLFIINKCTIEEKNNLRNQITKELIYLGYDISHKGTQYLITAIEYVTQTENKETGKLEKNIYPILSNIHNNSIHNIKCNINRANSMMYYECESEKLQAYFKFQIDTRPKTKTVINTIISKVS